MKTRPIVSLMVAVACTATASVVDAQMFGPARPRPSTPRAAGTAPSGMTSWNSAAVRSIVAETREAVSAARKAGVRVGALPSERVSVYDQKAIAAYAPVTATARGYGVDMSPDRCEFYIRQAERQYGIPPYLLHAISLTESGRGGRPNPLAMNVGGKAYSAPDVATMVQVANANWGVQNVDVGCMQISLKHHGGRFNDWRTLLDPQYNVEYAAYYLHQLHRELGTWTRAVGAYHSRTPWRGANYVCLVTRRWGQIFGSDRSGCGPNLELMSQMLYRNASWSG